jgi:hypothetical protein
LNDLRGRGQAVFDMNSLIHAIGLVAVSWFINYSYVTLGNTYLGFVGIGLFFLLLALTVKAFQDDLAQWKMGRPERRRGR